MSTSKRTLVFLFCCPLVACAGGWDSGDEPGGNYLASNNGFPLDPRAVEGVRPVLGKTWASGIGNLRGRNLKAYDQRTASCSLDFTVVGEARWCAAGECDFAYTINVVPHEVWTADRDISIEDCEPLLPRVPGQHDLQLRGARLFLDGEAQPGSFYYFDHTAGHFEWQYPEEEVGYDVVYSWIRLEFSPDALMYL